MQSDKLAQKSKPLFNHTESQSMKLILQILTVLSILAGLAILASAKSAIHEIEAFLLLLISAVFLSGLTIVSAIEKTKIETK